MKQETNNTKIKRVFTQTIGVVAAIIEKNGKIILVKENMKGHPDHGKWNHPAGWIDVGENPLEAIRREVKEETGLTFKPINILGIYSLVRNDLKKYRGGETPHVIKIVFLGKFLNKKREKLADDISETKWFSPEEIFKMKQILRDKNIKQMVKNYFRGIKYPLEILHHTISR